MMKKWIATVAGLGLLVGTQVGCDDYSFAYAALDGFYGGGYYVDEYYYEDVYYETIDYGYGGWFYDGFFW